MNIDRILAPIDYSDCSRAALRYALGLAETLGARLTVAHVWDEPSYVANTPAPADLDRPSLIELVRATAERDLTEFLAEFEVPPNVAVDRRLLAGEPAASLLEELKNGAYDLVVAGTHGRTGLSHLLLGSVADKLVRLSRVPVLVVPRPPRG